MRTILKSDEAHWAGPERYWASVQQFAPRKMSAWERVCAFLALVRRS